MMETEVWRPVVGYEGIYEVSNRSRVKVLAKKQSVYSRRWHTTYIADFPEKILIPQTGSNGRVHFGLRKNGVTKSVSRAAIVAKAWVSGYMPGLEINHIDEDITNDSPDNLEWCTHLYNIRYGTRTARAISNMIKKKARAVKVFTKDGKFVSAHRTISEAAKIYNCCHENISKCCRGKIKSLAGYVWRYV